MSSAVDAGGAGWLACERVGQKVDLDDLVGTHEIAERLGLRRIHLVHDWRRRHPEFPAPLAQISGVWLWSWRDVETWARRTGRL